MSRRGLRGDRVVLGLYAILVSVSGLIGVLIAAFVDDLQPPQLFFLIELPPTATGLALYGAVTVGVALGVPLLLIVYISRRADGVETRR